LARIGSAIALPGALTGPWGPWGPCKCDKRRARRRSRGYYRRAHSCAPRVRMEYCLVLPPIDNALPATSPHAPAATSASSNFGICRRVARIRAARRLPTPPASPGAPARARGRARPPGEMHPRSGRAARAFDGKSSPALPRAPQRAPRSRAPPPAAPNLPPPQTYHRLTPPPAPNPPPRSAAAGEHHHHLQSGLVAPCEPLWVGKALLSPAVITEGVDLGFGSRVSRGAAALRRLAAVALWVVVFATYRQLCGHLARLRAQWSFR
jgi:hypothetical protein